MPEKVLGWCWKGLKGWGWHQVWLGLPRILALRSRIRVQDAWSNSTTRKQAISNLIYIYLSIYSPTLLASSGWEQSEQPYYLYFPPPSTVLPYYRTASLPYYRKDLTTVKTVRQFRTMTDDRLRIVFRARTGESYGTTSGGRFFCWRLKLL